MHRGRNHVKSVASKGESNGQGKTYRSGIE